MNLIQLLSSISPRWRQDISNDPIEAAIELGLIEDDDGNPPDVDFKDPESLRAAQDFYRDYMDDKEDE